MASRAPAPPLRRRERQWAGLAADGVGGEAGRGGMLWTGGRRNDVRFPTSSRRKEEPSVASPCRIRGEKERRFPNPDVSHPPLHELTHTYGLPLHELTSTSTFALLRAIFAPVAASHTPSSFSLLRSQLARLAPCCRGYSWLVLVFSAARLVFRSRGLPCPPALARRSHSSCTPMAGNVPALRAENGGPGLSGDGRLYMT